MNTIRHVQPRLVPSLRSMARHYTLTPTPPRNDKWWLPKYDGSWKDNCLVVGGVLIGYYGSGLIRRALYEKETADKQEQEKANAA